MSQQHISDDVSLKKRTTDSAWRMHKKEFMNPVDGALRRKTTRNSWILHRQDAMNYMSGSAKRKQVEEMWDEHECAKRARLADASLDDFLMPITADVPSISGKSASVADRFFIHLNGNVRQRRDRCYHNRRHGERAVAYHSSHQLLRELDDVIDAALSIFRGFSEKDGYELTRRVEESCTIGGFRPSQLLTYAHGLRGEYLSAERPFDECFATLRSRIGIESYLETKEEVHNAMVAVAGGERDFSDYSFDSSMRPFEMPLHHLEMLRVHEGKDVALKLALSKVPCQNGQKMDTAGLYSYHARSTSLANGTQAMPQSRPDPELKMTHLPLNPQISVPLSYSL